mmetsp:Transcript_13858/g.33438  ORF Transcript_13858/g.33438 Transcript_13858/m.33438 type:complete len:249 (+) Transcript_13858:5134-5880(+)
MTGSRSPGTTCVTRFDRVASTAGDSRMTVRYTVRVYRWSCAVTVRATSVRPGGIWMSYSTTGVSHGAARTPSVSRGAEMTAIWLLFPGTSSCVAATTRPARRSRAAAATVTASTAWCTTTACIVDTAVSDTEDSGGTKGGARMYACRTVRVASRFTPRPVTSLLTLLTRRRPSSASTAGYARVTSRRYTRVNCAAGSCAVTSTATGVTPSRSSMSRLAARFAISTAFTLTACARWSITAGMTRTLRTS